MSPARRKSRISGGVVFRTPGGKVGVIPDTEYLSLAYFFVILGTQLSSVDFFHYFSGDQVTDNASDSEKSVSQDFRKELREASIKSVVAGILGGVVVAVGAIWAFGSQIAAGAVSSGVESAVISKLKDKNSDLAKEIEKGVLDELPIGAVVPFNTGESEPCIGEKWERFKPGASRFIVGAGFRQTGKLTPRPPFKELPEQAIGGAETITLAENNLPAHSHNSYGVSRGGEAVRNGSGLTAVSGVEPDTEIVGKPTGGGEEIDIMPPYIALHFCIKVQ